GTSLLGNNEERQGVQVKGHSASFFLAQEDKDKEGKKEEKEKEGKKEEKEKRKGEKKHKIKGKKNPKHDVPAGLK
ncbi:hypothetical protein DPMN_189680, partial [Dreissena polymorpha]